MKKFFGYFTFVRILTISALIQMCVALLNEYVGKVESATYNSVWVVIFLVLIVIERQKNEPS